MRGKRFYNALLPPIPPFQQLGELCQRIDDDPRPIRIAIEVSLPGAAIVSAILISHPSVAKKASLTRQGDASPRGSHP
jgi:hypothetical protein